MPENLVLFAGQMPFLGYFPRVSVGLSVAVVVIAWVLGSPSASAGQDAQPPPSTNGSTTTSLDPDRLPVNVDRIQRALSQPPAIKLESERAVFRIEIFARKPTIEDILGRDFLRGPAPYGGMTHQEFLNMVTPKDVQGYAAFSNKQAITVAATSLALQWALQKAIQKYNDAKEERAKEAAKREVEEALAELRRARRAAGLPDK
jgi:hypothetical protein